MKTKLLLLFLTIASFVNVQAQVILDPVSSNITSNSATISATLYGNGTINTFYQLATGNANNVESSAYQGAQLMPGVYALVNLSRNLSGLLPNTTYYYRFVASASGVANQFSNINSFTTASLTPNISAISISVTSNTANIRYTINPKTSAATSVIKYGFSASALDSQLAGFSAPANTNTSGTATLTNLLVNTLYFYQIDATNADGTTSSTTGNFRTNKALQIISEYTFDNTLKNSNGNTPFDTKSGMLYVPNRFGATDKALYINGTGTSATIADLPVNSSSRSISIWIRPTEVNNDNVIFTYGTGSGNFAYGASFNSTTMFNFSYSTNLSYATSTVINNWKHMVYTYEQSTGVAKIYIDGVLKNYGTFSAWNTGNNGVFYLGSLFGSGSEYKGYVDDLKIYNYALSDAEVANLHTNNTLSSQNFNQNNPEVSLYPNPVKDILHIETAGEIKSVTVYGILGNQVLTSVEKEVNVSNLSKGTYIVKIQDTNNAVSTKKFIKE